MWIQDPNGDVATHPGWVKIEGPGLNTSAIRIISISDDSGLKKVRLQPSSLIMMKNLSELTQSQLFRIGATTPPPSQTTDDGTTPGFNNGTKSSIGIVWKNEYWFLVVVLIGLGYKFIFKK